MRYENLGVSHPIGKQWPALACAVGTVACICPERRPEIRLLKSHGLPVVRALIGGEYFHVSL
jgi:hypothetical protein